MAGSFTFTFIDFKLVRTNNTLLKMSTIASTSLVILDKEEDYLP
jgi:hypothetical protein